MAITTVLTDDFDPNVTDDVETIQFGYKGKTYELDLGPENHKQADEFFGEYIAVARPVTATVASGSKRARSLTRTRTADTDTQKIREWAAAHGHDVSKRGRISDDVRNAYLAANPSAPMSTEAAASTA